MEQTKTGNCKVELAGMVIVHLQGCFYRQTDFSLTQLKMNISCSITLEFATAAGSQMSLLSQILISVMKM